MKLIVEIELEDDGRWLAENGEISGVIAVRLEHGEQDPNFQNITFAAA